MGGCVSYCCECAEERESKEWRSWRSKRIQEYIRIHCVYDERGVVHMSELMLGTYAYMTSVAPPLRDSKDWIIKQLEDAIRMEIMQRIYDRHSIRIWDMGKTQGTLITGLRIVDMVPHSLRAY